MAEIDKQKEKVGIIKSFLLLFVSAFFALIGYVFDKIEKLSSFQLTLINIAGIILMILIIIFSILLKKELNKLKDL